MRTRILPKMLNSEVEEYLQRNDIIIVPVGTVEMHGGFPLDSETVISEAYALRMAEACDGLVLTGLPYFYAGATASGRGTVQVSVRQGIDYLSAVAHSLLRQGFKRQVYVSFHGPAHMTCRPMVRDFFDEHSRAARPSMISSGWLTKVLPSAIASPNKVTTCPQPPFPMRKPAKSWPMRVSLSSKRL